MTPSDALEYFFTPGTIIGLRSVTDRMNEHYCAEPRNDRTGALNVIRDAKITKT